MKAGKKQKKFLDKIKSPDELKILSINELDSLGAEIRKEIITTVANTGGHLAPSLGVVELTIALHYVFDTPKDKIIWDVGHQSYAHKLITGRQPRFHTLRTYGGISGFPKRSESPYDTFDTGHSSTSISAGLGIATAKALKGERSRVIAIIGDGSMTAGIAYEGLNQAGHTQKDLIVVLNDNAMSISPNVGAFSSFLSRKMSGRRFVHLRKELYGFLKAIPGVGENMLNLVKKRTIPAKVIEKVGVDKIIVISTPSKLKETPFLRVDTGNRKIDNLFMKKEFFLVVIGYRLSRFVKVQTNNF